MLDTKENEYIFIFMVERNFREIVLRDYLKIKHFSAALLRKIKINGKIIVNGKKRRLYETVMPGDNIIIELEKELSDIKPEKQLINLVYEDNDLLVINKPPNMVTHPLRRYPEGTLLNVAQFYLKEKENEIKLRLVNRLDKDTSGLVVLSKNLYGHTFVQNQLKEESVKKVYWAVVSGRLKKKEGVIDAPIGRFQKDSVIRKVMKEGKKAVTLYRVIWESAEASLLELMPKTGRTHQLRVHLQFLGHPIIGDELYNKKSSYINRQALHAGKMEVILPRSQERIILKAQLHEDIKRLLGFFGANVKNEIEDFLL